MKFVIVVQLLGHVWLSDSMNWSTPGFLVPHHLLQFAQVHVHRVGNAIQSTISSSVTLSSCLQSFPASGSFPMSQLFASGGQSIGAPASVLLKSIQGWFPLGFIGWISFLSEGLSRVFSSTTVQKLQFFGALSSLLSSSHICTWLLERPYPWLYGPLLAKWYLRLLTHCLGLS